MLLGGTRGDLPVKYSGPPFNDRIPTAIVYQGNVTVYVKVHWASLRDDDASYELVFSVILVDSNGKEDILLNAQGVAQGFSLIMNTVDFGVMRLKLMDKSYANLILNAVPLN